MPSRLTLPKQQQGVALITMLLVFSIVVILVAGIVSRSSYNIRKQDAQQQNLQAYQYALGAEALARQILHQDWENDKQFERGDSLTEAWAKEHIFEPDDGQMRLLIQDMNGRFNVNNVVKADGTSNQQAQQQWKALLNQLGINSSDAHVLADWVDADSQAQGGNSEDSYFISQEPASRSADRPMASVWELRALDYFNQRELEQLLPQVSALPSNNSKINPNTASADVLSSLNLKLNSSAVVAARSSLEAGFASLDEFMEHQVMAAVPVNQNLLTVHSEYFMVWVVARYQQQTVYLRSLLHRNPATGTIVLLWRSRQKPETFENPFLDTAVNNSIP